MITVGLQHAAKVNEKCCEKEQTVTQQKNSQSSVEPLLRLLDAH